MWNEQNVARLRELWNEGDSAAMIAAKLGFTRNAVIGKVHRLGLGGHVTRHSIAGSFDRPRRSISRQPREPRQPKSRKNVRHLPERTKSELYAVLAQAVRNTVALQQAA